MLLITVLYSLQVNSLFEFGELIKNVYGSNSNSASAIPSASNLSIYSNFSSHNTTNNFSLAAVGDIGCKPNSQDTLTNIQLNKPHLIIALGDLSYRSTADCFIEMVKPIEKNMKIVIGNHDVQYPQKLDQLMNHFGLKEQYYSFDYQNTHFLQMSSEIPYKKGSKQYDFVNKDLNKAASDPSINWIIVSVHKDFYTSKSGHAALVSMRNTYHELFDRYNVDLVLQGHIHNYQRSYPLNYNIDNSSNPIITDNSSNRYVDPKGPIFVIVGTGGQGQHNFTGEKNFYTVNRYLGYGFIQIEFLNNNTLIAKFYTNVDNSIKDQFIITKSNRSNFE